MSKNKKELENEIDLLELILIVWDHRFKYIFTMVIGLIIGLAFTTHYNNPRYETIFTVSGGNLILKKNMLVDLEFMQHLLNHNAEISNKNIYSYVKKSGNDLIFKVESDQRNIQEPVITIVKEILTRELEQEKKLAKVLHSVIDFKTIIVQINDDYIRNQALAEIPMSELLDDIDIHFNEPKIIHPDQLKYGSLGILLGFFLAMLWMLVFIFYRKIREQLNK